ncbi:hypothetical protein [Streptomyces triculaminicus]|uniref:hypothetical protein n=1 Tax=Streptomyces triculaminicus TaxID=2816232 RepID=UPI00378E416A
MTEGALDGKDVLIGITSDEVTAFFKADPHLRGAPLWCSGGVLVGPHSSGIDRHEPLDVADRGSTFAFACAVLSIRAAYHPTMIHRSRSLDDGT